MHACHQTYKFCKQAICRIACVAGAWKYLGEKKSGCARGKHAPSRAPFYLSWVGLGAIDFWFGFFRLATLGFTLQENFIIYK